MKKRNPVKTALLTLVLCAGVMASAQGWAASKATALSSLSATNLKAVAKPATPVDFVVTLTYADPIATGVTSAFANWFTPAGYDEFQFWVKPGAFVSVTQGAMPMGTPLINLSGNSAPNNTFFGLYLHPNILPQSCRDMILAAQHTAAIASIVTTSLTAYPSIVLNFKGALGQAYATSASILGGILVVDSAASVTCLTATATP